MTLKGTCSTVTHTSDGEGRKEAVDDNVVLVLQVFLLELRQQTLLAPDAVAEDAVAVAATGTVNQFLFSEYIKYFQMSNYYYYLVYSSPFPRDKA